MLPLKITVWSSTAPWIALREGGLPSSQRCLAAGARGRRGAHGDAHTHSASSASSFATPCSANNAHSLYAEERAFSNSCVLLCSKLYLHKKDPQTLKYCEDRLNRWLSAGPSLSEACLCVEWLPLCISIGITTVHSGAISIATVLHSATEMIMSYLILFNLSLQYINSCGSFLCNSAELGPNSRSCPVISPSMFTSKTRNLSEGVLGVIRV